MLRVRGLTLGFGAEPIPILENVGFELKTGQFASLIGPSGSGKTSILRAITELLTPLAGTVECDVPLNQVGFLFQDDALLPWRTARQNVALGLRIRGLGQQPAEDKAEQWLSLLGLKGFGGRYPRQLSGDRKSTRLNSSHIQKSRMPSSA